MEENNKVATNKATYKQKLFAKAIAKELKIKDFDIKNYDTKEKCFEFIKKYVDEFHRVKTEKANATPSQETKQEATEVATEEVSSDDLPF